MMISDPFGISIVTHDLMPKDLMYLIDSTLAQRLAKGMEDYPRWAESVERTVPPALWAKYEAIRIVHEVMADEIEHLRAAGVEITNWQQRWRLEQSKAIRGMRADMLASIQVINTKARVL